MKNLRPFQGDDQNKKFFFSKNQVKFIHQQSQPFKRPFAILYRTNKLFTTNSFERFWLKNQKF